MLSKNLVDALRGEFHDKFYHASQRDGYIKEATENVTAFFEGKEVQGCTCLEDAITMLMTASASLGYYIGINDGANMIHTLISPNLPDEILKTTGDLIK